jgi:class 3 adenylate cyclase
MHEASIVIVDLVGYSDIQRQLEQALGVGAARDLDAQIQGFIETALTKVGGTPADSILARTGDGGQLKFALPGTALSFSAELQAAATRHNAGVTEAIAKRVFRIGIATGELAFSAETGALSGMTYTRAARLESKADPGGILIDEASCDGSVEALRVGYHGPETINGKRDERFVAWRARIDMTTVPANLATTSPRAAMLDAIAADFKRLRPDQIDTLIVRLGIDRDRAPPDTISGGSRKSKILLWAHEEDALLQLAQELRAIVGTPPA